MFSVSRAALGVESNSSQSDALLQVIRRHVAEVTSWKESEIQIRSMASFTSTELPAGEVTFRVSNKEPLSTYRNALIPVEILQDGKLVRTAWIATDIAIRATVVQAARRLQYGDAISEGDVKEILTEILDARAQYLRSYTDAIGKVLRRTLSPGDPLTREHLSNPLMVHSGETVQVRLERGPIVLSATARAEQDGKLGEMIRIRNLDFSKPLKAMVIGRAEVRID